MTFEYGCAKKLYAQNIHPRLVLGPGDVAHLRAKIRSGDGRKIMTALRARVKPLVQSVLDAPDPAEFLAWKTRSWNDPGILVLMALTDIALVATLDGQADAIEAVRRVMAVLCRPERKSAWLSSLAVPYDLLHAHLTPGERELVAGTVTEFVQRQVKASLQHHFKHAGGNTVVGESLDVIPLLLAVTGDAGVPPLNEELDQLILMFEASLHTTTNPDGYPEEDIGYGTGVSSWLCWAGEMLRRAGSYDIYKACPRYARFGRAVLHFVQPWGEDLSNTGDHGDDFQHREFVLARLAKETRDPSLLWLLGTLHYSHGKVHPQNTLPDYYVEVPLRKGFRTPASALSLLVLDELKGEVHPARRRIPTQFLDRGRGILSFRSGWNADDTLVVFDGSQRSPAAQGHFHASCGHFSLSALGEYFSIDTGRYGVEQNQHSVVLIDGQSGRSTNGEWMGTDWHGNLIDYRPGEFADFAAVDSSHQHNCYWARRYLGFVKGHGAPAYAWTVEDINKANDWAEFWWQLQTSPENTIETHGDSATITGWRHGNCLDVHFALPAANEYPKPHVLAVVQDVSTTSSYKYVTNIEASVKAFCRPAEMVHGPCYSRPRLLGKVGGYNGRFMSIMIPRRKGSKPARVERLASVPNSLAVSITYPHVVDTLIYAYEHNLLEAAGVQGRGQWCVVRRARKDGKLLAFELGHGTALAVDGRKVRLNPRRPARR